MTAELPFPHQENNMGFVPGCILYCLPLFLSLLCLATDIDEG